MRLDHKNIDHINKTIYNSPLLGLDEALQYMSQGYTILPAKERSLNITTTEDYFNRQLNKLNKFMNTKYKPLKS